LAPGVIHIWLFQSRVHVIVKLALIIATAGGHNIIIIGSPNAGNTMLARRLPTILPPLTLEEALEATKIHSITGKIDDHSHL